MTKELSGIEVIYNFLVNNPKKYSFKDIWNKLSDKFPKNHSKDKEEYIANLYSDMVLDNRFLLEEDGLWTLKQNIPFANINKKYTKTSIFGDTKEFQDLTHTKSGEYNEDFLDEDDYYEGSNEDYGEISDFN